MTAQKDQIQRLIHDIHQVLSRSQSRLPWGTVTQARRQRQLLERIERYLQAELAKTSQHSQIDAVPSGNQAQEMMQSIVQEMTALRSSLLHPLHSEIAALTQQRTALLQEIRQLEAHRQTLQNTPSAGMSPSSIEALQGVSDRADQMLTTLDTTLKVVFESLQKDIHTYHDSLSQGVEKLHTLGCQSEAMFSGLVRQLAEQFGRDAATYLPESAAAIAQPELEVPPLPEEPEALSLNSDTTDGEIKMPYAGTEFASSGQSIAELQASETIHSLGELFNDLPDPESTPIAAPAAAPRRGLTPDTPLSPEIRALREAMLPLFHGTEPAQLNISAETSYSPSESAQQATELSLKPELPPQEASSLNVKDNSSLLDIPESSGVPLRSTSSSSANVFTLNGIDNIFLDEENP